MDLNFGKNISRELLFPLLDMRLFKKDMIRILPNELLRLTWSCRKPSKTKDGKSLYLVVNVILVWK